MDLRQKGDWIHFHPTMTMLSYPVHFEVGRQERGFHAAGVFRFPEPHDSGKENPKRPLASRWKSANGVKGMVRRRVIPPGLDVSFLQIRFITVSGLCVETAARAGLNFFTRNSFYK
jgi:hypothetical protein